jgi:hypothetical protein
MLCKTHGRGKSHALTLIAQIKEDGPDSPSIAAQDARANDGLDLDIGADDMHMLPVANSSGARTRKTKSARKPGRKIAKAPTGQAQRATTSTRTSGRAQKKTAKAAALQMAAAKRRKTGMKLVLSSSSSDDESD